MRTLEWFSKALLIAGVLTVLGLGAIALQPAQAETDGLNTKKCEDYPSAVFCKQNRTKGGPTGCFYTLCEAVAAGAFSCKPQFPSCEPILSGDAR